MNPQCEHDDCEDDADVICTHCDGKLCLSHMNGYLCFTCDPPEEN
jgi:hypothetical protein